jgi:hypothetical protein
MSHAYAHPVIVLTVAQPLGTSWMPCGCERVPADPKHSSLWQETVSRWYCASCVAGGGTQCNRRAAAPYSECRCWQKTHALEEPVWLSPPRKRCVLRRRASVLVGAGASSYGQAQTARARLLALG